MLHIYEIQRYQIGNLLSVNLMDIDALEPAIITSDSKTKDSSKSKRKDTSKSKAKKNNNSPFKPLKSTPRKQKSSEKEDLFFGLQTVEDLLGGVSEDHPPSVASEEVRTESEDIPEEIGPPKKKTTSFHSVLESEIKEVSSVHRSYSDDFDDTISEHIGESHKRLSRASSRNTDVEEYTETFQSESEITESGTVTETDESEIVER